MSAAILRQAAQRIRNRLEEIELVRWNADVRTKPDTARVYFDPEATDANAAGANWVPMHGYPEQALWVAMMNPVVGEAIAEWLDQVAERIEEIHESLPFTAQVALSSLNVTAVDQAVKVAQEILATEKVEAS